MQVSDEEFERLILENTPAMWRAARAVSVSDAEAEDAVGDAVLTAWRRIDTLRDPAAARAWLVRIAVNCARLRLRDRHGEVPLDDVSGFLPAPERDGSLSEAVAALPPDRRVVVTLHYFEGFSVKEIAKLLSLRQGTVKSRLARAREELRKILEDENGRA